MTILSSVALGWLGRRVLDWGGVIGGFLWIILKTYGELPPSIQDMIGRVMQGHWEEITLGAVLGFGAWAFGQFKSYKATVQPQIVTREGQKVELERLPPAAQADVTITAKQAPRRRTLADLLAEKLGRQSR